MRDYNKWTNAVDDSFEELYELYEKDIIRINDEVDIECIVDDANEWQENVDYIFLIKKDKGSIKYGDYLSYNDNDYLVHFNVEDRGYYWAAKSRLCNFKFPIVTGTTEIFKGYDNLSRPVYETQETYKYFPCIVSKSTYTIDDQQAINVVDGKINVTLPYSTLIIDQVKVGFQFMYFNEKYQVQGIDMTGTIKNSGVIKILADKV